MRVITSQLGFATTRNVVPTVNYTCGYASLVGSHNSIRGCYRSLVGPLRVFWWAVTRWRKNDLLKSWPTFYWFDKPCLLKCSSTFNSALISMLSNYPLGNTENFQMHWTRMSRILVQSRKEAVKLIASRQST